MIAKNNTLIINCLYKSSLQVSLQSCQLTSLTCLQDQAALFTDCKEKTIHNQRVKYFLFAAFFADNLN